jgi:hypothetical protein
VGQCGGGGTCISGDNIGDPCGDDDDCLPNSTGSCGVWWMANTGSWKTGGSIHVSYANVAASANPGNVFIHEFTHLVFDARDEYQSRAVGCGVLLGAADCPDAATQALGEDPSIMDNSSATEYCWGHGDPADLSDVSNGNHDATDVTEQSRCRNNRSVWDQVVWAWPNTILAPIGAPDPGTNGAVLNAPNIINVDNDRRLVLVLDESGSMGTETPTRLSRLQVAALDFVTLAESGTELGIVSYSTDADPANGHADVAIAPLGADRSDWEDAIVNLNPYGMTNIGDALDRARDMIMLSGVTANTFVVLMTDGLNNRPQPNPATDLQSKLNDLLADGIPVLVTCTGSDLGLDSQCAEIAAATNGFYTDSADPADMQDAFVVMHEKTRRSDPTQTATGVLDEEVEDTFYVEQGAASVTFTMTWLNADTSAHGIVEDPDGNRFQMSSIPQGGYLRFDNPISGDWTVSPFYVITPSVDFYTTRAFVQSPVAQLAGSATKASVNPGEPIKLLAFPRYGGSIINESRQLIGEVIRPDGTTEDVVLSDGGRIAGTGDDVPDDGEYTGLYANTQLGGAYTFIINLDSEGWISNEDGILGAGIPRFQRELRITAAVNEEPCEIQPDTYSITSLATGKVMDVEEYSYDDAANIHQWEWVNAANQKWALVLKDNENCIFELQPLHAPLKCLDVSDASLEDGANLQQYTCNGSSAQEFYVTSTEIEGVYEIVNTNSDKCVDVWLDNYDDGANIQQGECYHGENQRWRFEVVDPFNHTNLFVNPDFDYGLNGWITVIESWEDDILAEEGAARFYSEDPLQADWGMQLYQTFYANAGETYTLSMELRTESGEYRSVDIFIEEEGNDYTSFGETVCDVNPDKPVRCYVTAEITETTLVKFGVKGADNAVDFFIDNAILINHQESSCGDGVCNNGENCATCPSDCGSCGDGCTCPNGCGAVVNATVPTVVDGVNDTCYFFDDLGSYINNWNNVQVDINSVDITNTYLGSGDYPSEVNGGYYIYQKGEYPWSHIEVM